MRVGLEVHLAASPIGDVGVALRRPQVGVTEHLLDGPEVGASFEEMCRERVAEEVRMDATRLEARSVGQLPQDQERTGTCERSTSCVQEELGPVATIEMRTPEREVAPNRLRGRSPERHEALLVALAQHANDALLDRHAPLLEPCGLGDAKPGAIQEFDERAIPERAWSRSDRGVDETFRLGGRERARQRAGTAR